MFERPQSGERAVLVHIVLRYQTEQADLQELAELVRAAGALPIVNITAVRDKPDPKYYVGKGKLEEILEALTTYEGQVVIFNHDLTPSQERNIERHIKCRVLSRTGLILDIFAQRARTFEGKLQVELAQLQHLSTRLVRGWMHLERQKGGIGLRGPGETQLEVDRRLIHDRILTIQKRLLKVRRQRDQSRHARQRAGVPTIAFVGYTNAGKSTLFNALTGAQTWVANQLFATLDPTLRALTLPRVGKVVLADTVGFIRQLPHALVDAFRATLEETDQATLLVHVIDASDENQEAHRHAVNDVLNEIGAAEIPQLLVFNKIDLLSEEKASLYTTQRDKAGSILQVGVSALKRIRLDLLREALQGRVGMEMVEVVLHLCPQQGQLRAQLYALQAITHEVIDEKGEYQIHIRMTKWGWEKLCQQYTGLAEEGNYGRVWRSRE